MFHVLEERGYNARIKFPSWCTENIKLDASFFSRDDVSREYVFHVDGSMNKPKIGN